MFHDIKTATFAFYKTIMFKILMSYVFGRLL
jgi:hypothetical protein